MAELSRACDCVARVTAALPSSIGSRAHLPNCPNHSQNNSQSHDRPETLFSHHFLRRMASAVMAATQVVAVAGLGSSILRPSSHTHALRGSFKVSGGSGRRVASPVVRAAKLPQGVGTPKEEPKLPVPLWGFTENAEVWNSRASMIGIFGILIVEALIHKGLLQSIGIDVGKGLDLPL